MHINLSEKIIKHLKFACLFLLISLNYAHAAQPVDAGSIQRDIEKLNTPNLPPVVPAKSSDDAVPAQQSDVAVTIKTFQFIGAKLLPEALLQAEVASYIGQTLDYNGLNLVTKKISELYRKKGWLAKVYLPPQDIQNGLVTIEINEAKLGDVKTNSNANVRLNPKLATNMLASSQQKGEPLNNQALERAMLLINDAPGFQAQATLSPGVQTGETDLALNLSDRAIFNANVSADNYGSHLIGKARVSGQLNFNNLTGWGDALNVHAIKSRGLEYVSGGLEFPLGYAGTRMNIGAAVTNYEVVGDGLSDLEAEGESYSLRASIKHPIIRSLNSNLQFQASVEQLNSTDEALGFEISDKRYRAFTLGLKGDSSDSFGTGLGFGGGTFWGGISLTTGNLDLQNSEDLAADKLSTRTDGGYNKLNFYLGRQQILTEKWSAKALLSGQLADGNLGGFEKFSLGGPAGLQGFTVGEAAADRGWMLNTEARYAVTSQFSASLLADAGGVCQFKNTWAGWNAGNPKLENCYQLASVGFGLGYAHQLFDARLSYGRQITGNRGLDANDNDSEGKSRKHQLWLQISSNF
jgi:hemolysin activation/secretion protein